MVWALLPFTVIGMALVAGIIAVALAELWIKARQAHRIATINARAGKPKRRYPTWHEWYRVTLWELRHSGYSTLVIRLYELDRNLRRSIGGREPDTRFGMASTVIAASNEKRQRQRSSFGSRHRGVIRGASPAA